MLDENLMDEFMRPSACLTPRVLQIPPQRCEKRRSRKKGRGWGGRGWLGPPKQSAARVLGRGLLFGSATARAMARQCRAKIWGTALPRHGMWHNTSAKSQARVATPATPPCMARQCYNVAACMVAQPKGLVF